MLFQITIKKAQNNKTAENSHMKILVCEDDTITLKALEYSLTREGYKVYAAADGKEGADLLRENINEIGMMITDHHMPYFSGMELVHLVRNELKNNFPIIMLSRVNLDETKKLALSLGVDEYMTKPFLPRHLLIRINRMLKNHR